jgi:hypothetical protein
MPLWAGSEKGRQFDRIAGSQSIRRDCPDLRPANRTAAFCGRGAPISPCNRVSDPCEDLPGNPALSWAVQQITEGGERTNQPIGC